MAWWIVLHPHAETPQEILEKSFLSAPLSRFSNARSPGGHHARGGVRLHTLRELSQQQSQTPGGDGANADEEIQRRSTFQLGRTDTAAWRWAQNGQCHTGGHLQKSGTRCWHTRFPRQPPPRSGTETLHNAIQRGNGTEKTHSWEPGSRLTLLVATPRPLYLHQQKSPLRQMRTGLPVQERRQKGGALNCFKTSPLTTTSCHKTTYLFLDRFQERGRSD